MNCGLARAILLLVGYLFLPSNGQHRGPSRTPISTKQPQLPGGTLRTFEDAFPGPFIKDARFPFPTNSWWQGFTITNVQNNRAAGPFPFRTKTENDGLQFGMGTKRTLNDGTLEVGAYEEFDLSISIAKLPVKIDNRKCTGWDTQTLSLQYLATDNSTMDTTLVPGSPYLTFKFNKAHVSVKGLWGNISFTWDTAGKRGRVISGGREYRMYVIAGTLNQFAVASNALTFTAVFTGTIRFARLIDTKQKPILDSYSTTYATALTMAYNVQGDVGTTTWTWDVVGDPTKLLMMSWPHHRKVLVQPNFVDIEYVNIKGRMKGVLGNKWTQKFNLPPVKTKATLPPHPSCLDELKKTLEFDVNNNLEVSKPGNVYWWALGISRYATMATIADSLGLVEIRNKIVDVVKTSFDFWLDSTRSGLIAYEPEWGGAVTQGDNNSIYFNDHHFTYGYHLYASAVVGKFDPAWLSSRVDYFNQFARDYGNPSPDDPYFTVARHMDFFAGHSWASGVASGAGERNQESTSEAVNAYYSLMLYGDASKNTELMKWGRLLLAIELIGAQTYWHMYPNSTDPENPYPEPDFRKFVTVGNLYPAGVNTITHFGKKKIHVAAIQIVPVTSMGEKLYDKDWMEQLVPYCSNELKNVSESDKWKSPIYAAYAKVNPKLAYNYSDDLEIYGEGNTASNQLYFISTQAPVDGDNICSNINRHTPEGLFVIQDVQSGNYVGTPATNPIGAPNRKLRAYLKSSVIATPFELAFAPYGGTIKSTWDDMFVNGDTGGAGLRPNKAIVREHEKFRWKQVGSGYELKAMVNKYTVKADSSGVLLNNGASPPGNFRLIPTLPQNPIVPAQGKLQSVQTNLFVVSTSSATTLLAKAPLKADGTTFRFEKVAGKDVYVIWNTLNSKAVTANPSGTSNLAATATSAQAWEKFRLIFDNGQFVFIHQVDELAVAVDGTGKLFNNDVEVGTRARFNIVA